MNPSAWKRFLKAKERFRKEVDSLERTLPELGAYQQKLVDGRSPSYTVETPAVYNNALDDVGRDGEIKLILVGDNPGRREQAAENRRYLVGPSGKIAEKFFRDNPSLGIDFRKNVIILNKTPIHTPRTANLRQLCQLGGAVLEETLDESQRFMARLLLEFHEALAGGGRIPPVWITGYGEMGKNGVFAAYTEELKAVYGKNGLKKSVFLYQHFSMNRFTIDLKKQTLPGEPLTRTLRRTGTAYRKRFLR
jgi:hypothetical protein